MGNQRNLPIEPLRQWTVTYESNEPFCILYEVIPVTYIQFPYRQRTYYTLYITKLDQGKR